MRLRPTKQSLLLTLGLAGLFISIVHAADLVEELKVCAKMTDRDARLACYDNLGQRVLGEDSADDQVPPEMAVQAAAEEATGTGTTSNAPSLPDHLGGTTFAEKPQPDKAPDKGLVTSCKKGANNRWYFFFENGQVWKESNTRRRRFDECNFIATITRDSFGYKMQIEGETGKIRVRRRK